MNRRGFLKYAALSPLALLLKPKQPVQWIIPKDGAKQYKGIKYPVRCTPETVLEWARKHRIEFKASKVWQGRIDIEKYNRATNKFEVMRPQGIT